MSVVVVAILVSITRCTFFLVTLVHYLRSYTFLLFSSFVSCAFLTVQLVVRSFPNSPLYRSSLAHNFSLYIFEITAHGSVSVV